MLVATATDLVTEQVEGERFTTLEVARYLLWMRSITIYRMCYENLFAPIAFVFRRQVFEDIGYFDQNLRGYGDWDFQLRFLQRYDIDYLDTPAALVFYHQRPEATGDHRNSVFTDDQQVLAERMFNKWLRADLERGHLGLGYVLNTLCNRPFDPRGAHSAVMALVDGRADQVVLTLSQPRRLPQTTPGGTAVRLLAPARTGRTERSWRIRAANRWAPPGRQEPSER